MRRISLPVVFVVSAVFALGLLTAALAQAPGPAAPAGPQEGQLPQSIKQAYGAADKFGEEATPAQAAKPQPAGPRGKRPSPWLDKVHDVGLVGGGLMVVNLVLGATIFLGAWRRSLTQTTRDRRDVWHYAVGLTALSLGAGHALGRFLQVGAFRVYDKPAFVLACTAILLAGSGMLRAWTRRKLPRLQPVWTWAHRVLILAAVALLTGHVIHAVLRLLQTRAGG